MTPKVSVIIPVYNVEKYLTKCLDSVVNQTLSDIEIICINDGSTDNSLEILNEYAQNDTRIIVLNQENKGQSYCRNIGLKIASGDYISFLDSDDFISQNFLEEMVKSATLTHSDIVMCNFLRVDKTTDKRNDNLFNTKTYEKLTDKLSLIKNGSCCNKLFSSHLIKNYKLDFPIDYLYEDNEFLLKAIYYANKLSTTDKCSYFYCNNPKSTMNKTNYLKLKQSASVILEHVFSFFNSKNLTKKELNLLISFCINSFCFSYIEDDDFLLPSSLNKREIISMMIKTKYKNVFQRIFSVLNISSKTKLLTILFIPIKLKRRAKG